MIIAGHSLDWLTQNMKNDLEQRCAAFAIPLGIPVGWISVESDGNPKSTTSLKEYGLFQIMPSESADLDFDHQRIYDDPVYGMDCGFKLVDYYRTITRKTTAQYGFGGTCVLGTEFFWRVCKLHHSMGIGAARHCLQDAATVSSCTDWPALSQYLCDNNGSYLAKIHESTKKWCGLVDDFAAIGTPFGLETLVCTV